MILNNQQSAKKSKTLMRGKQMKKKKTKSSGSMYNPFSLLRQKAVQNFIKRKFQFVKFLLYCLFWYAFIVGIFMFFYLGIGKEEGITSLIHSINVMIRGEDIKQCFDKATVIGIIEFLTFDVVVAACIIGRAVKLFLVPINPIVYATCATVYSTCYERKEDTVKTDNQVDIGEMKNSSDIIADRITVRYWIMYPRGKFLHDVKFRIQLEDRQKDEGNNRIVLDLKEQQGSARGVSEQTFKIATNELTTDFERFCNALNDTLKVEQTEEMIRNIDNWRLIFSITGVNDEGNIITKAKSYDCSHVFLNTKFANIEINACDISDKPNKGDGIYCRYQNFNKIICMGHKDIDKDMEYAVVKHKIDEQCPTAKVLKSSEEAMDDGWTIRIINLLTMHHYRKYKMSKNIMRSILRRLKIDTD